MCLALGAVVGLVGTAASLYGQYSQAQGAQATASYNAAIARQQGAVAAAQGEFNAQTSEAEAAQARTTAAYEADRSRTKAGYALAADRAAIGASGLGFEGSPLEVLAFNAGQAELDAQAIRYGGEVRASSLEGQAASQRYQGALGIIQGEQRAGVSLLTGQTAANQAYGQAFNAGIKGAASLLTSKASWS